MRGLIFILGSISLTAQQATIDEAIAKVIPISGLWEAPLDPENILSPKAKGIILNIETIVTTKEERVVPAIRIVKLKTDISGNYDVDSWNFYEGFDQTDLHHLHLERPEQRIRLTATIDHNKQTIDGTLTRGVKSQSVSFTRLPVRSPLDGTWNISGSDTHAFTVSFQIAHSIVGKPLMAYYIRAKGRDTGLIRLGESWDCEERNDKISARADRPALGGDMKLKLSSDGNALQASGSGRVGFLSPATFIKSELKDLLLQ